MKEETPICLPQLTNDIVTSARKTRLCAYAVALEGWRRGLKLKWYTKDSEHFKDMIVFGVNPPGRLFSLSSDERTHYFFRTRGDKVTNEAVRIGSEKDETKIWLEKAGVPVPLGRGFLEENEDEDIVKYGITLGFPLVLKPTNGSLGNGVITNIRSEQELRKAVNYVRHELEYREVIIEQYVAGEEYRVYVIEDSVIAAYNRVPANIIGDGVHTVAELIDLKNNQRKKNARLFSCLIEMDVEIIEFLQSAGYDLQSVPQKGELIYLRQKTNVSSGGDPIDVTDDLPEEIKDIAIRAINAVPGLYHGGVDIIINPDKPIEQAAVVIELNPTAQIGGILFPLKGKSRDIPGAIIDYYFPETKGIDTRGSKVYFDFITALEPLENRSGIEVEVAPAPKGELYSKKYTVNGTVHRYSFHQWLKQQALDKNMHGFIKNSMYGNIEVVIAGTDKHEVNNYKNLFYEVPKKKAKVQKVSEEIWKEPIKIGFEISEKYKISSLKSVDTAIKKMEKDLKDINKQIIKTEKENRKIVESNSWKYTRIIRKIGDLIKRVTGTRKKSSPDVN
ncbi:acylphosphatase [Evansella clarkii]|uniref:acylphosphatase n=1 Tax=Evansella clarkii TaxID=79879 RepID=UPI000B43B020|nr:acylphosphatase [Evansella clarkii]